MFEPEISLFYYSQIFKHKKILLTTRLAFYSELKNIFEFDKNEKKIEIRKIMFDTKNKF